MRGRDYRFGRWCFNDGQIEDRHVDECRIAVADRLV